MKASERPQPRNTRVFSEGNDSGDENRVESVRCGRLSRSTARVLRAGKIDGLNFLKYPLR